MAEALVGGAALGAVFGELLKAVSKTTNKAIMFKPILVYLQYTLEAIAPVVTQMEQFNNDLGRPKKDLETLISKMKEGTKLVYKCSNIHRFNYVARVYYHDQLMALVNLLEKFFNINIQAQIARNQLETLFKVDRILSAVKKILPVNGEDTTASSSDSAPMPVDVSESEIHDTVPAAGTNSIEQVMEPITGTTQEAGQSKAKEGNNQGMEHLVGEKSYDQLATTEKRFLGIRIPKIGGSNRQDKKATSSEQNNKPDTGDDKTSYSKRVPPNEIVFLDSPSTFVIEDLLRASAELLGKGTYGTTYKAILDDGSATVAVKRLRELKVSKTEFEKQVELLRTLFPHHPNVCPLRAYYHSVEEKLLIYDYIAGGSFSALMHERANPRWTQLDLKSRMKISLGAAKGLAHIHSVNGMDFVHGNIKSSNVIVTTDFKGCISDFGMTHLLGLSVIPSGNKGYRAPEVIETGKLTQMSDVYSFGILLQEMLTCKLPVEDTDLPSKVELQARDGLALFDDAFKDGTEVRDIGLDMMRLVRACTSTVPNMRPSMDEVVWKIETITSKFEYAMKTDSVEEANEQIDQVTRSSSSDSDTVAVDVSESGSTATQQAKDAAGTNSEKQVMEPLIGTKQEAGQTKAKEGNNQGLKHFVSEKSYDHLPKMATSIKQNNELDAGDDKKSYSNQYRGNKLLGKGSYGETHQAISLDGSETVVIRKLTNVMLSKTEFEKQAKILRTSFSHHPNVCPPRDYSYSSERKLLMYDYIAGRSLSALMHERSNTRRTQLKWASIMKISLGASKGIAHIHSVSGMDFVHGNIKSSNVIVTADFKGWISDFGITHLLGLSVIPSVNKGYQAPEVIETGKLTQKSDVYSFGILLLEMLTGKSPMKDPGLPSWADLEPMELFDDALKDDIEVGDIGFDMMKLVRDCTSTVPNMRPSMDEVVRRIGTITFNYYSSI